MRQVTKYEANDGTLFDSAELAAAHERLMELKGWYCYNRMLSTYDDPVGWDKFLSYLKNNHDKVQEILDVCLNPSCENRSF